MSLSVARSRIGAGLLQEAAAAVRPRALAIALAFIALYAVLDRIGAMLAPVAPFRPGDMAGGLALAVLIWGGLRYAPAVLIADLASDLLSPTPGLGVVGMSVSSLGLIVTYCGAAWWLRRTGVPDFMSQRGLARFLGAAAIASLLRAGFDIALLNKWGPLGNDASAVARAWTSYFLGVAVVTPFLLVTPRFRPPYQSGNVLMAAIQALVLTGAMVVIMPLRLSDPFRYFYLLFLPQIWIAVRFGAVGAAAGNFSMQAGLVFLFLSPDHPTVTLFNFQFRLLAMCLSMLFLGSAVSERNRVEEALRNRQEELARVSRLSLAGEMAAALAHELNQPLTATVAFVRTAQRLLAREGKAAPDAKTVDAMDQAVEQAERAGSIIRTLRGFIGKGDGARAPRDLAAVVAQAMDLVHPACVRAGVRVERAIDKGLQVQVDEVGVQQVMINLVQNALDSLEAERRSGTRAGGEIVISASATEGGQVEVEVRDNGPGLAPLAQAHLFQPFASDKPSGMGLGLSVSRGIVEAHGGKLWLAESRPGRCAFRFTLPAARSRSKRAA